MGAASIFLSPKTCAYSIEKDQPEIWTVSERTKHASRCLCFAGLAKPLALNWNANRTIYCNWCFLESSLNKFNESSACCLDHRRETSKRSDGIVPIMSSEFSPQSDSKISHCHRLKATKTSDGVRKTFIKAGNRMTFYGVMFWVNPNYNWKKPPRTQLDRTRRCEGTWCWVIYIHTALIHWVR